MKKKKSTAFVERCPKSRAGRDGERARHVGTWRILDAGLVSMVAYLRHCHGVRTSHAFE